MYALIPAAGRGVRFGSSENKVFAPLLGRPLLGWTLQAFADCSSIDKIVLIGSEADLPRLRAIGEQYGGGKLADVVLGGETRQESVRRGLDAVPREVEYVVVHDAARCCIPPVQIAAVTAWLKKFDAVSLAVPVSDTLVREHDTGTSSAEMGDSVSRDGLWAIQTPQAFQRADLQEAHERAAAEGFAGTDDAGLVRRLGKGVQLAQGTPQNIKVTHAQDLVLAEAILMQGQQAPTPGPSPSEGRGEQTTSQLPLAESADGLVSPLPSEGEGPGVGARPNAFPFRVGHGYDVHSFAEGRPMWLGGVHFPESPKGLEGHSDADAVLHAVCDALLGAAGLGDIGVLFPPSDMRHKDRPSIEFLQEVRARLDAAGWRVGNVDITVLAEYPKIGPRAGAIKQVIAVCLDVDAAQISVKATTNEKMGFVGRGEGIAAHATVLLYR